MNKSNTKSKAKAKAEAEVAPAKRGRPVVAGSKRQERMAARQAKLAAGVEVKRGRPKKATA